MKFWAYHPDGIVRSVEPLDDAHVPGEGIFDQWAADMTDVTALDPRPAERWTTADGGKTFSPPPPEPVFVPDRCTKLGLKRALAETGADAVFPQPEWLAVKTAIAQDQDLQEDWDLAVEIRRADPLVQAMIAVRKYDAATVDKILVRANTLAG